MEKLSVGIINKLKEIETLVELSIGTTMTKDTATEIYAITNDLMCNFKKPNVLLSDCSISYNPDDEMMLIEDKDNKSVFYGNYWDLNRDPEAIAKLLTSLGLKVYIDDELKTVD